ncbi:hypothetical protein [Pseudoduganella plicata]|uniref:Uncharacterized protein n=1 Tax=Pseudoduganella plicata TaxID=321984 RepID=A0ABX5SDH4_9BURK|nr:hypothetical protein [Pseudoduganella plicata]QBQ38431.1 hypothetical protein E1742_21310 [Pseudoduganella plicata]
MTQDVTESLDDLPEELHAPVRAYMANFINMVKSGVAVVNGESNHSGPDKHPDSDEVDRDWRQSFMDDGYLVTAWRANQKQPAGRYSRNGGWCQSQRYSCSLTCIPRAVTASCKFMPHWLRLRMAASNSVTT